MANMYYRILEPTSLAPSTKQARTDALDAGAYKSLQCEFRVLKAGSAGNLSLEHAAVNEEDAYLALSGTSVAVTAAGGTLVSVSNFLRWVRWVTDGSIAGGPVALIDVVAKE